MSKTRISTGFMAAILTAVYFAAIRVSAPTYPADLRDAPMSEQEMDDAMTGNWGAFPRRPGNVRVPEVREPEAPSCEAQSAALEARLYREYKLEDLRKITLRVQGKATAAETGEMNAMSAKFHALPPGHIEEMAALQDRAKVITRAIVGRAGYKILNPETGTPFDALIAQKYSSDGIQETSTEARALLILRDPRPHVTLWYHRNDPAHNPRHVVSLGVMGNKSQDYASWRSRGTGPRVSGSMTDFVRSLLPPECAGAPAQ